ncbi:MAG: polysaccharide ABC transporter ATP-binding protein [Anaerolineales bacterium]
MSIAISIENISKTYHLGQISTGTFANDMQVWWAKVRGKSNPLLKIGAQDHGNREGEDLWALRDVSFTVKQGEALGIIGRNGAGKSTLLKILSRVTAPTSGKIKVRGRVASLLEVGTGFHPDLTGRENIYLNGAILGMNRKEIGRKFDEIVDFAGIEKFIDTPVKRYSSGMYVRLAFAVAAHLEPEILVVDEVLAVGDAAFQKKCLGKMEDVASQGRTVLFVSHNMGAITGLTRQCIYMRAGALVEKGDTSEVVDSYMSEMSSENRQREGFADLRGVRRSSGIVNPVAQFEWVRTLNADGIEKSWFIKGQPFLIEAGFLLTQPSVDFQFGFGAKHAQSGVEVFVSPSPVYHDSLPVGHHKIQIRVEPNDLRTGLYSVILKMFSQSVRQDTLGETLFFEVTENPNIVKQDTFQERWASGLLDLRFQWDGISPLDDFSPGK